MDSLFLANLGSPPLLFFFLGMAAVFVRSDLDIPGQIARFLSLYLLFAIGFKGGVALASADLGPSVWFSLGAAMLMSAAVPLYSFFLLKGRLGVADAVFPGDGAAHGDAELVELELILADLPAKRTMSWRRSPKT